jgi:phytoene dehydrogenase-like protein
VPGFFTKALSKAQGERRAGGKRDKGRHVDALDVVVVGGGTSGLVCALALARNGLAVRLVEDKPAVGGGSRTEFPFGRAPRLAASTGAHRLGFVHPDLLRILGVSVPMRPRDPSTFAPTTSRGVGLLAAAGSGGLRDAVARISPEDVQAIELMHGELDAIVSDLRPAWLSGPLSIEETADRFVRASLREAFVGLCRGSIVAYLDRIGLRSDLVRATLAADALSATWAAPDAPGTGAPLLLRHAARAIEGGGDAVPAGGIGAVVRALADAALAAGVTIVTGRGATQIVVEGNTAVGVLLADGELLRADTVVASADPWRLRAMVGDDKLPPEYLRKLDGFVNRGTIAKVNLALADLPRFTALPEDRGQHRAVIHLLAGGAEGAAMRALSAAFAEADASRIPTSPPLECVFPTAAEPDLCDAEGRHHASIVVGWTPYDLDGTTWAVEEERFVGQVIAALDRFAPGAAGLVVDAFALHPKKLETHFGVTRGHPYHLDESIVFGDRLPYATPIGGLYACGAGCAPAGAMLGVAGYNAAMRVIADLEVALERTDVGVTG